MNNIYRKYKERLVEISGKNRSLYSKKIGKSFAYDIGRILQKDFENSATFLDFLMKGKRTGFTLISKETRPFLYEALGMAEKIDKKFKSISKPENADARAESLRKERFKKEELKKANIAQVNHLRTLKREVEEFAKETGRYEMFVGYPFVQGELNRDTMIKAPLLLFPVTINIRDEFTVDLEFKKDEPIQLNKVFILAYAKQHKLVIDDLIQEFDNENKFNFKSIREVLDYLNKFDFKLRYKEKNFFEDFELGGEPHRGEKLNIRNYAVVGRFPLANSIYNDYAILEKEKLSTPAIELLLNNREFATGKKVVNKDNFPITESDYSQAKSLEEIDKFGNVVIFGPPGTGKSQSIVNIISDSLAKKKRVLLVSQKKVATDVVYNRLGALANKTMYITDINKSSTMFYDKIKRVHNEIMQEFSNNAIDEHNKLTSEINSEVSHLEDLSNALFNPLLYGVCLQELYSDSLQVKKGTREFKIYSALQTNKIMEYNHATLKDILNKIVDKKIDKLYFRYEKLIDKNSFVSFVNLDVNIEDLSTLKEFVQKLLSSNLQTFDFGKYALLRPVLLMKMVGAGVDNKDIDKMIAIAVKSENKKIASKEYKEKFEELKKRFKELEEEVKNFVGEDSLLKKALTKEGYSLIVDNILTGSKTNLKLLDSTLKDYSTIKDMRQNIQLLNEKEIEVLKFALLLSKTEEEMRGVISVLLQIRNFHEIVKAEEKEDRKLSLILDYENTKQRILTLKSELLESNKKIAYNAFNEEYKNFYSSSKNNKDYLYIINKQENMWNIRRTMEFFSDYLLRLFPCWLMSPENVSSIMPLKRDLFDVVIFDEASQIFIENSIPAIYRGKCVAIAGDRKQLKPTTTFMKRYIGNESFDDLTLTEQAALEVESLLDLATSRYTNAYLNYHYRSKYEELINFSNYAFYDEKLEISPNISKNVVKPIERIKVNGIWQDRHNHEEAVEVVKLIKKILKERTNNQTIGVITFNTEQENYIEDIIEVECKKDPEFKEAYLKEANRKDDGEDTGLFIKNIENVQGEERDIIIFSIGYAKNERGKIVAQFGALSMEGGENRLNVAITRAKEKIYVVTSIEPEELNVSYSKNLGPKVLKKYLQYVRAVSFGNKYEQKIILESLRKKTIVKSEEVGGIEMDIKKELEKRKYVVDANIGNAKYKINLAIYNKKLDRYVLGIEIDSNAYHSSESLLERDVFRTNFLNSRGWNIFRLWSRDWWKDKEKTLELIENKIKKATAKVIEDIKNSKKKVKKSDVKSNLEQIEDKNLAGNLFEKVIEDEKVVGSRLSKKVLAKLKEDEENQASKQAEIEKLNEVADYNLVLEDIDLDEPKTKKQNKVNSNEETEEVTDGENLDDVKLSKKVAKADGKINKKIKKYNPEKERKIRQKRAQKILKEQQKEEAQLIKAKEKEKIEAKKAKEARAKQKQKEAMKKQAEQEKIAMKKAKAERARIEKEQKAKAKKAKVQESTAILIEKEKPKSQATITFASTSAKIDAYNRMLTEQATQEQIESQDNNNKKVKEKKVKKVKEKKVKEKKVKENIKETKDADKPKTSQSTLGALSALKDLQKVNAKSHKDIEKANKEKEKADKKQAKLDKKQAKKELKQAKLEKKKLQEDMKMLEIEAKKKVSSKTESEKSKLKNEETKVELNAQTKQKVGSKQTSKNSEKQEVGTSEEELKSAKIEIKKEKSSAKKSVEKVDSEIKETKVGNADLKKTEKAKQTEKLTKKDFDLLLNKEKPTQAKAEKKVPLEKVENKPANSKTVENKSIKKEPAKKLVEEKSESKPETSVNKTSNLNRLSALQSMQERLKNLDKTKK